MHDHCRSNRPQLRRRRRSAPLALGRIATGGATGTGQDRHPAAPSDVPAAILEQLCPRQWYRAELQTVGSQRVTEPSRLHSGLRW